MLCPTSHASNFRRSYLCITASDAILSLLSGGVALCIAIELACKHDDALFRLSHSYPILQRLIGFSYASLLLAKASLVLVCLALVLRYDGDIVTAAAAADVRPDRASLGPDGAARRAFNKRQAVVRFLTRACGASPVVELALGIGIITFWYSSNQFPRVALPTAKERLHAHRGDQLFAGFIITWIGCVLISLAFFFVASWHHSRVDWQIQMLLAEEQLAPVRRAPTVRLGGNTGCPDRRIVESQSKMENSSSLRSASPGRISRLSTLVEQTEPASSEHTVTIVAKGSTQTSPRAAFAGLASPPAPPPPSSSLPSASLSSPVSSTKSHFSMGLGPGAEMFEVSLLAQRAAFAKMKREHFNEKAGDEKGETQNGEEVADKEDDGKDDLSLSQKELRRLTVAAFTWSGAGKQLSEGDCSSSKDFTQTTADEKMEEGRSRGSGNAEEKVKRPVSMFVQKRSDDVAVLSPRQESTSEVNLRASVCQKKTALMTASFVDRDKRKDSTPISSAVSVDEESLLCTKEPICGQHHASGPIRTIGAEMTQDNTKVVERSGTLESANDDYATVPSTIDVQFDMLRPAQCDDKISCAGTNNSPASEEHDGEVSMGQPGSALCDVDGSDLATVVVQDQARRLASHVVNDDEDHKDGGEQVKSVKNSCDRKSNEEEAGASMSPLLMPLNVHVGRSGGSHLFPSTPSPGFTMTLQLQQQQQQQQLNHERVEVLMTASESTRIRNEKESKDRQKARAHAENVLINATARTKAEKEKGRQG